METGRVKDAELRITKRIRELLFGRGDVLIERMFDILNNRCEESVSFLRQGLGSDGARAVAEAITHNTSQKNIVNFDRT